MPKCPPGVDLVFLGASIATVISTDLTAEEITLLSSVFSAIGDNLGIISDQIALCEAKA